MQNESEPIKRRINIEIFLFIILISNFFRNLGTSIVDIGLPHFILSLSGTLISYGIVVGIFSVTQSIFQFPIASASDKYGRKLMIGIGMSVYIAGTLLCYFAETIAELVLFRAVQGAGAYSSILQAMTGEHFEKEKQGRAMSLYSFSLSLGYFGGIVIGGYLAYYFNFRFVFLISGTLAFISLILIFTFFKNSGKSNISNHDDSSEKRKKSDFLNNIKILMTDRQFFLTVILNSIRWMFMNGSMVFMIWVLEIHWGFNEIETSYLMIFIVLAYVSTILFGGQLVDRFGSKRILMLGQIFVILSGFLFFSLMISMIFVVFFIGAVISGIGFALCLTSGNANISNVIEKNDPSLKGSGFGLNNTVGFICGALGPIIISYLGIFSIYFPFYFITIIIFIALLVTLKFIEA